MGGNFEIIIVIIGLAWAIASSVMQKKAKAAKAARLKAIAQEDIASSATSAAPEPSETMFDRMMSQLREQIDVVSEPVAPQRSGSGGGSAANIGAAVKVKPPASVPDPPVQMSDTKSAMQDSVHVAPAQPAPGRTARSDQGRIDAQSLRAILGDPSRIREAILLKEILDRPLSLRN